MKKIACVLAVVAIAFAASTASAAEPQGTVSSDTLAAIGLSDLQVMSDIEGQQVRGTFAIVGGVATTNFNLFGSSASTTNFYAAGDFGGGPDFAVGAAGGVSGGFISFGGPPIAVGVFAVGGSVAFAGP